MEKQNTCKFSLKQNEICMFFLSLQDSVDSSIDASPGSHGNSGVVRDPTPIEEVEVVWQAGGERGQAGKRPRPSHEGESYKELL